MQDTNPQYDAAVADVLSKEPTRELYDLETPEGIEDWQNDKRQWLYESMVRLVAVAEATGLHIPGVTENK